MSVASSDDHYLKNFATIRGTSRPVALVLGGSTFMGRETVNALLNQTIPVCVVNRGNAYWGTRDPARGLTARVLADRRFPYQYSARLAAATDRLGGSGRWGMVVDFSAFSGRDIRTALNGLRGRFDVYIYISSDSVYEVCASAAADWQIDSASVDESLAVRPDGFLARWRLRYADWYGDGKLEAEEALHDGLSKWPSAGHAIALRLPDVIGPFDDTMRLWAYWHWLQNGQDEPLQLPEDDDTPLAFVFSKDVARFVASRVDADQPQTAGRCDFVNLACTCQPTLKEFVTLMADVSDLPLHAAFPEDPETFYPSVSRPWPLCCDRARQLYEFTPTTLREAVRSCVDWFVDAPNIYPQQARDAASMLPPGAREVALARLSQSEVNSESDSEAEQHMAQCLGIRL